ncbi:LysR family transcriptional regulator [Evansella halocellulosilytica]|uniref:LysR family transcriptional regulator n=1 Tax=Evansella halocellulosilytica TaxID=2011013 RepID=UPI000BB74FD1|nr:LysR family transcriptional regulator [Evansella halocellulosilytica]
MKVEEYELIVALDETRTIRGAAENLFISQPAISQRLKQIEQDWGVELFIRTPRRLIPTNAGEKIVEHAKKVMVEERRIRHELDSISNEVGGVLSLGISSLVGQYVLPSILEAYVEKYPNVKVQLKTGLSQSIRENIEKFHVAIVRGERVRGQKCEHFFSDEMYFIDREDFVNNDRRPFIEFQADDSLKSDIRKWFVEQKDIHVAQTIEVDQIETCKQLMKKGLGMTVLPASAMKDLQEGFVKTSLNSKTPHIRETWISYHERSKELPQVTAFLQELYHYRI